MVYKLCTRGQTKQERASPFWRNRAMDRHCLSDPRRGPLQRRDEPRLQALLGVALQAVQVQGLIHAALAKARFRGEPGLFVGAKSV